MSVFALSLRAALLRPRTVGIALLPLGVAAVAVGIRLGAGAGAQLPAYGQLTGDLLVSLVVALVALVLGVSAVGDEREEGTLALLMATAVPRWRLAAAKVAAAWLATWVLCLPAVTACAWLGVTGADLDGGTVVWSVVAASALASGGYVALFVALSLFVRRGVLIGLAYVVIWEGSLAAYATAFRNLSVGSYGRRLVGAVFPPDGVPFSVADVSAGAAAVLLFAVVAAGTALASWRLPHLDV